MQGRAQNFAVFFFLFKLVLGTPLSSDVHLSRVKRSMAVDGVSDGAVHVLPEADVMEMCLNAHNYVRSLHADLPPLTWSSDLARGAEEWAAKLVAEGNIRHTTFDERVASCNADCGENIYSRWRDPAKTVRDGSNAVFAWYNEHICWDFDASAKKPSGACANTYTGHLTQVLWKDTTEVGCGIATLSSDHVNRKGQLKKNKFQNTVLVARYMNPGNFIFQIRENVPAPKSGAVMPTSADDLRLAALDL